VRAPIAAESSSIFLNEVSYQRKRLLLFTTTLGGGGAEKHVARLANQLHAGDFEVAVAVVRGGGSYEREVDPSVRLHVLGTGRMIAAIGQLRALIREVRPDLVFSVLDHASCVALAATMGLRNAPPVVAGVQSTPSIVHARGGMRSRVVLRLMPLLFPRAAAVVAISEGVKQDLLSVVPRVADRTHVIYNVGLDAAVKQMIDMQPPVDLPGLSGDRLLVACGRLTEQKGFSDLLDAFALLRRQHRLRLWILGEGELRPELERKAERLGLRDHVWMPGFVSNPYALMARADVFVLSSLWEGFGNVIVEAMASGAPVVATDCPHGPAEIIRHERNGLLVPVQDPQAMCSAIDRMLRDDGLRERLRDAGERRSEDFTAEKIGARYGAFFNELIRCGHRAAPAPSARSVLRRMADHST
jgi:glycosyltransferase involved in cell wall biosynthesis